MIPAFEAHSSHSWPLPCADTAAPVLRVGSYNIRVDHSADDGTQHEWRYRRPLTATAISRLDCDLLLIQEPGPPAAADIADDIGAEYAVAVEPCDPSKWSDPSTRKQGQEFDGNGFVWRKARLELIGEIGRIYLSTTPDMPGGGLWDGSPFSRTAVEARFKDRQNGAVWHCFSAHFDHLGEQARIESAKLLMARAAAAAGNGITVVVAGDFNTFPDAFGPETYAALAEGAESAGLVDVRAAPDVEVVDFGVSGHSWKGWEGQKFCRRQNVEQHAARGQDASRFDHMFVSRSASVRWTGVVEEAAWADASDHVPLLAEFICT